MAERRALEAVDFIARNRPQAAAAWLEELIERVGELDPGGRDEGGDYYAHGG